MSSEAVEASLGRIFRKIRTTGEKEIPSTQVGEFVMEELRGLDEVAYVRFASVYRRFEDLSAFMDEIQKLARKKK